MPQALGAVGAGVGIAAGVKALTSKGPRAPGIGEQYYWSTQPRYTQFSGLNISQKGNYSPGYTYIDPSIRQLRNATLENLPGYRSTITGGYDTYNQNLNSLAEQLQGNANPYIQARVNPIKEQAARGRGELARGLERRRVFGPLAADAMSAYDVGTSRAVSDQGALATQDTINQMLGIDTAQYNSALSSVDALKGLDAQQLAVVQQNLAQELASLGLSEAQINGTLGALQMQSQQLQDERYGRGLYTLGAGLEGLSKYLPGNGLDSGGALTDWWKDQNNLSALSGYYGK